MDTVPRLNRTKYYYTLLILFLFPVGTPELSQAQAVYEPHATSILTYPQTAFLDLLNISEGGTCWEVTMKTGIICAEFAGLISVLDATDPMNLEKIGNVRLQNAVTDMVTNGNYVYVLDMNGPISVVNITDPSSPVFVKKNVNGTSGWGMAVQGDYLYVVGGLTHGRGGIRIIDISNPADPVDVGFYYLDYSSYGVAAKGDRAYFVPYGSGIGVLDVSTPSNPILDTVIPTPEGPRSIDGSDSVLVAANHRGSSTYIIDIRDPDNPYLSDSLPGSESDVVVDGSYAYLVAYSIYGGHLRIVDVSDPSNVSVVDSTVGFEGGKALAKSGDLLAIAMVSGVSVMDVSTPTSPLLMDRHDSHGWMSRVASAGDYLAIAYEYEDGRFVMKNKSNPEEQYSISSSHPYVDATDLEVQGDYAYVSYDDEVFYTGGGIQIIDISDPTAPIEVAYVYVPRVFWLNVVGTRTYYGDETELVVLNSTDPANPSVLGRYDFAHHWKKPKGIAVSGSYGYVTLGDSGLVVMDVSIPSSMVILKRLVTGVSMAQVAVDGDYLYITTGTQDTTGGLLVYDISSPTDPFEISSFDAGGGSYQRHLTFDGSYLHLTGDRDHIYRILDISDPYNPVEVVRTYSWYIQGRIALDVPYIWAVGTDNGSLIKFQTNVATAAEKNPTYTSRLYQNFPNPFNPLTVIRYELAVPGRVSLKLYDVTGTLVKILYDGFRSRGNFEARWDGRNEQGSCVSSGVYFYQMKSPGFCQTRKMVFIK